MQLLPDLEALVLSFLPARRSLAHNMCVAAISRVQDVLSLDMVPSTEWGVHLRTEILTHDSIIYTCRRYGAHFGSFPTMRLLRQHMRLIEDLYLCLGIECEFTRLGFAPSRRGRPLPVFDFKRISQFLSYGSNLCLYCGVCHLHGYMYC